MFQACTIASLDALHVSCKLVGALWGLSEILKKRALRLGRNVERCFILLCCFTIFLGCLDKGCRHRHGELVHEADPVDEAGGGGEESGHGVVGNIVWLGLVKKIAGHGHSNDTFKLE